MPVRVRNQSTDGPFITWDPFYRQHDIYRDDDTGVIFLEYHSDPNPGGHNVTRTTGTRWMSDVISEGAGRDHPCSQVVYNERFILIPKAVSEPVYVDESGYHGPGHPHVTRISTTELMTPGYCALFRTYSKPTVALLKTYDFGDLASRHYYKVLNPLKQSISLVNFLLELEDCRRVFKTFSRAFKRNHDQFSGRFRDPLLAYQLGILPFIGDISGLIKSFRAVADGMRRLRTSQDKPIRIETRADWTRDFGGYGREQDSEADAEEGIPGFAWDTTSMQVEAWIVSRVSYDFSQISPLEATLYAASQAYGFSNPLQVVWNAIPYSFVVDWIVNVSQMLEYFNLANGFIPAKVTSCTTHVRAVRSQNVYSYILMGGVPIWGDQPPLVGYSSGKAYMRFVGSPPRDTLFSIGDASFRELVLASMLAHALGVRHSKSLVQFAKLRWDKVRTLLKNREVFKLVPRVVRDT